METQPELLATVLDEQEGRTTLTTPETVADGIHQAGDLALSPVGKMPLAPFMQEHPLLTIREAADDVNQIHRGRQGGESGDVDHVFI